MPEKMTIIEAAKIALERLGRAARISEIYAKILQLELYEFNTPEPEHVLRTQIRRATFGVEVEDAVRRKVFALAGDETYEIMKEPDKKPFTIGMKRIHRASDKKHIIETLTSDETAAFREIWRLLLFAAALGFRNGRREPLVSVESGDAIRQELFGNCPAWPGILYLIGLVETGGTEVLMATEESEDIRIKGFEEYANGGLAILEEHFKTGNCNLDSLLNFIQAQTVEIQTKKPDLQISI
jgi:dnd system-associated protein 4